MLIIFSAALYEEKDLPLFFPIYACLPLSACSVTADPGFCVSSTASNELRRTAPQKSDSVWLCFQHLSWCT